MSLAGNKSLEKSIMLRKVEGERRIIMVMGMLLGDPKNQTKDRSTEGKYIMWSLVDTCLMVHSQLIKASILLSFSTCFRPTGPL